MGSLKVHNSTFIWPYVDPPVFEPYDFERFDVVKCRNWMEANWFISVYIASAYLFMIFVGQIWMRHRAPYNLKGPLVLWNFSFALFSFMGLWRTIPELWHVLSGPNGFHRSICVRDAHNEAAAFWAWAFTMSKVVELGDTVFIVLRKKPLMFVHYYHHSIALILSWCYYPDYEPIARWFGIINYFVHSFLYSYFFLKSLAFLPRVLSRAILFMELSQMIVGVATNLYAIQVKARGEPCARSDDSMHVQMLVYGSFLMLFTYLFCQSGKSAKKKDD